jgi:hypothetical protein
VYEFDLLAPLAYNNSSSTWGFGKKILVIPSSIAVHERGCFKQNAIKSHFASFIEVGHFRYFNASIVMRDKVGEYGLESDI